MRGQADAFAWLMLGPALAAFILPGWQLARRLALPALPLSAFLLSAAGFFALALLFQAAGAPLTRGPLLGAWLGLGLACSAWAWLGEKPARGNAASAGIDWRAWTPWMPAIALALASVTARVALDPLHGWDTSFRWDGLARAMLERGNFDFYPPRFAADFELCAWPDGMPPLVSLLNLWIYLACGASDSALTAGRTLAEVLLAAGAVFALARSLHGPKAGAPALAALAACPLFLWSGTMGQETALVAIAAASLAYFIIEYNRAGDRRLAFCAGLAGCLAALARDYTVLLAVAGAGLVLRRPGDRRAALLLYALPLLVAAAPWYARSWFLTGNPIFPVTLGIFPGNVVFDATMEAVNAYWSFSARAQALPALAATLACVALALAAGFPGLVSAGRRALPVWTLLAVATGLWAWSAGSTGGGWNYSLRVLAPAAALLAAGAGFVHALPKAARLALCLALTALAVDAARRSWLLPLEPRQPPLPYTFATWREHDAWKRELDAAKLWPALRNWAGAELVLADSSVTHTLVRRAGGRSACLFSPAAETTFDRDASLEESVARLRRAEARLLVLTTDDPVSDGWRRESLFFRTLATRPPDLILPGMAIYDLARLQRATDASAR